MSATRSRHQREPEPLSGRHAARTCPAGRAQSSSCRYRTQGCRFRRRRENVNLPHTPGVNEERYRIRLLQRPHSGVAAPRAATAGGAADVRDSGVVTPSIPRQNQGHGSARLAARSASIRSTAGEAQLRRCIHQRLGKGVTGREHASGVAVTGDAAAGGGTRPFTRWWASYSWPAFHS